MREGASKSMKLNRDLEKYIEKALEQGRPVKIGWGRAGDERPKEGEFGVMSHLPEGARVLCLGNLGECVGMANRGGTLTLRGSAGSMLGAFHQSGKTVVEKDVGARTGFKMIGGDITIQGSVDDEAGAGMAGGTILVRGHSGSNLGAGMKGGVIVVMGSVGLDPGIGMVGGRIIISGSCPPPPEGVDMRSIKKKEISEFGPLLDPLGLSLNEDALVLESANEVLTTDYLPDFSISEGFEKISLVQNENAISEHAPLDHLTLLVASDSEKDGLLLQIPWIVSCESPIGDDWQGAEIPAMVKTAPRANDLLLVGAEELGECVTSLKLCSGLVFDISEFPGLNDAEIEAILVSLRSRMEDQAIILLRGNIGRIEQLFRLVMDLKLDGAVVECATPNGSRLAAALPKIGLASKAIGIGTTGKFVFIETMNEPDAKDMLVAIGAGCTGLIAPTSGGDLPSKFVKLESELRGWMKEIGIDRMERIGRRNLRATDFDTAAISGLRLLGYDRPLKMWLDLR